jgi:hypothetical protein
MARAQTTSALLVALGCVMAPAVLCASHAGAQQDPDPAPPGDEYADTDPSALTDFRPALDPYGTWVDDPTYGDVWTPSPDEVGPDFVPYDTAGQWDYTDGDYSWVSYYQWGWVCFHYGRWAQSSGTWMWIPGRNYAGAWVTWRFTSSEPAYVGWAPTAPTWGWNSAGVAVPLGSVQQQPWTFTNAQGLFGPGLASRAVTGRAVASIAAGSRPYLRAAPSAPGAATQLAATHGPPPGLLGIDAAQVPHAPPSVGAREVRARQWAHPSTAQPLGARAPAPRGVRPQSVAPAMPRRGARR